MSEPHLIQLESDNRNIANLMYLRWCAEQEGSVASSKTDAVSPSQIQSLLSQMPELQEDRY